MAAKEMNPFERLKANGSFSPRSQASHRAGWMLERQLKTCSDQIGQADRRVTETGKEIAQMAESISHGHYVHPERISQANAFLQGQKKVLEELRKRRAAMERELAALTPAGSKRAKRIKGQAAFCQLGGKRFEIELEIVALAGKLRPLLERRQELSAAMRAAAPEIDLDLERDADCLDEERFDTLLRLLPSDMERLTREWAAWFTGEGEGQVYVVVSETLEVQETLASAGAFECEDRVRLTKAQAALPLSQAKIAIVVERETEVVASRL